MRIVQVVPEVRTGSGVEAVAHHLEQEWSKLGIKTERFTLADAAGGWLPKPGPGLAGKLAVIARVVWFSTIGTALGRAKWGNSDDETVVVCHNDALVGDVYVNHGIVAVAMKARGHALFRMLRNPLHLFTFARDKVRYSTSTHRFVVNQTHQSSDELLKTYGRVRPQPIVIGNGVETSTFTADAAERRRVRTELGLAEDAVVGIFVGHEFGRKGLPAIIAALQRVPDEFNLLVVGGTPEMVAENRQTAMEFGVSHRVVYVGTQTDVLPFIQASDVLVFPSAYESFSLVVSEALACALPVIATPVGSVPDLIVHGRNGFIVAGEASSIASAIRAYLGADRTSMAVEARRTAESHSWAAVAASYVDLFDRVLRERG